MMPKLPAQQAIDLVRSIIVDTSLPVFIVGSVVAAAKYDSVSDTAYHDIDLFTASPEALVATTMLLQSNGFELKPRFQRLWSRWLKNGVGKWHTNSIELQEPLSGIEVNVVHKLVNKQPTTSLLQVVESFDFGLLSIGGWDMLTNQYIDLRYALFAGGNIHQQDIDNGILPLMPSKRSDWRNGFISQYNGLRQMTRYLKYLSYGYDLRYVKDDLVAGYWGVADYLSDRDQPERQQLGQIYEAIALHLEADNFAQLEAAAKSIVSLDSLDQVMEALD